MSMSRGLRVQRRQVFGEALPAEVQALVQDGAGDVLDALHQLDQLLASPGLTGAKPTPQLPITAVVTPCMAEGARWLSHTAWPS